MALTLAVDAMGGDAGLPVTVPAVAQLLKRFSEVRVLLVGDAEQERGAVKRAGLASETRVEVVHASEVVSMDDQGSVALRNKKDSSMRVAINQVKEARAQASIRAGNTGALLPAARFVLTTLKGIDRPAI